MDEPRQEAETVSTVTWTGEVLTDSASKCRDELLKAFSSSDKVLLDMTECSEIDVSAIQLILAASLEASKTGKKFFVSGSVSPQVKKAFDVSGVNLDVLTRG